MRQLLLPPHLGGIRHLAPCHLNERLAELDGERREEEARLQRRLLLRLRAHLALAPVAHDVERSIEVMRGALLHDACGVGDGDAAVGTHHVVRDGELVLGRVVGCVHTLHARVPVSVGAEGVCAALARQLVGDGEFGVVHLLECSRRHLLGELERQLG